MFFKKIPYFHFFGIKNRTVQDGFNVYLGTRVKRNIN